MWDTPAKKFPNLLLQALPSDESRFCMQKLNQVVKSVRTWQKCQAIVEEWDDSTAVSDQTSDRRRSEHEGEEPGCWSCLSAPPPRGSSLFYEGLVSLDFQNPPFLFNLQLSNQTGRLWKGLGSTELSALQFSLACFDPKHLTQWSKLKFLIFLF